MQWQINRYHVADSDHVLDRGMPDESEFPFSRLRQMPAIEIVQAHVERLEPARNLEPMITAWARIWSYFDGVPSTNSRAPRKIATFANLCESE
jgi:hypothetical protein